MSILSILTKLNPGVLDKAKKLLAEQNKLEQRLKEIEKELRKLESNLGRVKNAKAKPGSKGKPGVRKHKTEEEIASIMQDMRSNALSIKQVAEKYAVAIPTVYKWTKESDSPTGKSKPRTKKVARKKASK
jgi:predicted  nucleic acid-binding Zn-ribbon protein